MGGWGGCISWGSVGVREDEPAHCFAVASRGQRIVTCAHLTGTGVPCSQGHTVDEALAWAAGEGGLEAELQGLVRSALATRTTPLTGM